MKKPNLIIIAILSLVIISCGQNKTGAILGDKSNLINIIGTKVFVPKTSFSLSEELPKLTNEKKAMILVTELPNDNFKSQALSLPPPNIERSGAKIIANTTYKISEYSAKRITIKSPEGEKISMLLFGNDSFCTVVTTKHKWDDLNSEKEIEYILSNIVYKESLIIDPLSTSPFTLSGISKHFKHYLKSQNTHFYTKDGNERTNLKKDPSLAIVYGQLSNINEFKPYFKELTKTEFIEDYAIDRENQLGYEGSFELENGNKRYYMLLRKELNFILVRGTAMENYENTLKEFKEFSSQIRWKN